MQRRRVIALGGAAAALPVLSLAQQPSAVPIIGFLHSGDAEQNAERVASFRKGLSNAGFVEGKNVAIEFRWADGKNERLPALASELIAKRVAVIATLSSTVAAVAAKKATSTVPIYFLVADSPVEIGLVASLNRPGGNATGISSLAAEVAAKRFSLLHELAPQARILSALLQPMHPSTPPVIASLKETSKALGVALEVIHARNDGEIEDAYRGFKPGDPLMVGTDPFFFVNRAKLAALSAQYRVPTIYDTRAYAEAGGLMSFGPNTVRLWEQAGGYVARILKGEKPADLPVVQAAVFETIINLKTAKALGLKIPDQLMARADDIIE